MDGTILILRPGLHNADSQADNLWTDDLENLGYTVLSAEEPGQALVHLQTGFVDLVVIDSNAESSNMVDSFVAMLDTEKHAPPFVLASSCPKAPTESARLGAVAFVPKPCQAGDLSHIFARVSPRARPSRAQL